MKLSLIHIRDWYGQNEHPISSIALIGGFAFDWLTLDRVDMLWQNAYVILLFIIVAASIILMNSQENEKKENNETSKSHFWYLNIMQFFFGGILSAFVILYFRSTALAATWPFLLILFIAFIANEFLKKHYSRLIFQISLFYLLLFSFTIFAVPVVFHRIGTDIFLASGAISLIFIFFVILALNYFAKEKFAQSKKIIAYSIAGIYLAINILYFANLIPPIPLSLKEAGVYHSIYRNSEGKYIVESEEKGLFNYFSFHDDIHVVKGDALYAHTAIFSPALFKNNISHVWQKYNENSNQWTSFYQVNLITTGGRDGGYRTYSYIKNIAPGKWRVNVETSDHKIIGRLRFNVIQVGTEPVLKSEVLN